MWRAAALLGLKEGPATLQRKVFDVSEKLAVLFLFFVFKHNADLKFKIRFFFNQFVIFGMFYIYLKCTV